MVADKEVAGSAIDSQVLAVAMRDDRNLRESLRIVDAFGPSTIQPIAVSKRVPLELRKEILNVLMKMHTRPAMRHQLQVGMVEKSVPVGPESYDDIRMMVQACEDAQFMQLR